MIARPTSAASPEAARSCYRGRMITWADQQVAKLRERFAARWDVWYVPLYPIGQSWHARPVGAPVSTISADSPEGLAERIEAAEVEAAERR